MMKVRAALTEEDLEGVRKPVRDGVVPAFVLGSFAATDQE